MQIFLLWRDRDEPLDPRRVESRLRGFYEPLLRGRPASTHLRAGGASAVYLELPVDGWIPPFLEQTESSWTLGLDYPVEARRALETRGIKPRPGGVLAAFADELEKDPAPLLREVSAPFVIAWRSRRDPNVLMIQNDGIGIGQIFVYDDGRRWAASNRIFAFKALGLDVKMEPAQWATQAVLGWFPLNDTGYRNISVIPPATRLRVEDGNVAGETFDVLDFLMNDTVPREEALELGRQAALDYARSAGELFGTASAGLTGGWDTRAVVSSFLAAGVDHFRLHVRGRRDVDDVVVAERLAQIIGKPLNVKTRGGLPPATASMLEKSMDEALRWQAGHAEFKGAKMFLNSNGRLDGGWVNIMGQHGAVGRGFYIGRTHAMELDPSQFEDKLLEYVSQWTRSFMRPPMREHAEETIRAAYRAADRHGVEGYNRLDFFYMYERTRRWASGGQYNQPGKVLTPFLTPGYIRASFSFPGPERVLNPVHRYIIDTNMPVWSKVPFHYEVTPKLRDEWARQWRRASRGNRAIARWRIWRERLDAMALFGGQLKNYRESGRRGFNNGNYWKAVGRPLIERALRDGGLWTEVYDPRLASQKWAEGPDDIVVLWLLEKICS
ncbi:MAG: hypothetical protein ABFD69_17270 [Candidatus Sumerlaeia bacterium]